MPDSTFAFLECRPLIFQMAPNRAGCHYSELLNKFMLCTKFPKCLYKAVSKSLWLGISTQTVLTETGILFLVTPEISESPQREIPFMKKAPHKRV